MELTSPKQFFADITRVLDQVAQEGTHRAVDDRPFRESLKAARARVEELHQAIEAAQEREAVLREELAGLIAQIMLHANTFTTDLVKTAAATAKEVIAAAEAEGNHAIQSAQERVKETLRDARKSADDAVAAAESLAEKITDGARLAADRAMHEARTRVAEIEQAAEKRVADLIAKVEAFAPQQEQISQSLEALANGYAGLAQEVAVLQADGQGKILPTLRDALQALRSENGGQRSSSPTQVAPPEPLAPTPPEDARTERRDVESVMDCTREAIVPKIGEIILQDVSSEEATAFTDALQRLRGVRAAVLQTYYHMAEVATLDVLTEEPLNLLNFSSLSGFEIEVVGAAEHSLTLHVKASRREL
jgi:hypothetical protein